MRYPKILLALAVAAPFALTACDDDDNGVEPPDNAAVDVNVTPTGFQPAALTLEPADSIAGSEGNGLPLKVSWKVESGQHNITFEAGASSANLNAGQMFERDFSNSQAGTFRYRCTLHSTDFVTGEVGRIDVIQ